MLLVPLVFLLVVPSKLDATCKDGWTPPKCIKTGVAVGDPHYKTFDGKEFEYYDFMGHYEYVFAREYKNVFEVLQQNEICNPSSSVTCTKSVRVVFGATEIELKRAGKVYVNKIHVKLPWIGSYSAECKSRYVAHGGACYKRREMKSRHRAICPDDEEFVVPKDRVENEFVYERFVKSSETPFWLNAGTRRCRRNSKLCDNKRNNLTYNNFFNDTIPPKLPCVQMTNQSALWTKSPTCREPKFYICKYKSTKISKKGNDVTLDVPSLHFSVHWDGSTRIQVDIEQRYEGKMRGLMGNADSNENNDFRLPNNSPANNTTEFGNSWRIKNGNVVKRSSAPPDTCKDLTQLQYNEIKKKCEKMKQPPFRKCNEKIAPDIHDCEYDLCAMQLNDPSAAWCEALENYAEDCAPKGINIDWKGEAAFKECGYPCAKMPCYNGAKCENINKKKYKCFCLPRFSGLTCENVRVTDE